MTDGTVAILDNIKRRRSVLDAPTGAGATPTGRERDRA
jgi:hypothetical protein